MMQPDDDRDDIPDAEIAESTVPGPPAETAAGSSGDAEDGGVLPPEDGMIEVMLPASQAAAEAEQALSHYVEIRPYVIAGLAVLFLLFGSFAVWSVAAPLARGVISPGELKVESSRKSIQHLEGGIIREIRAKEGANVEAGEVLIVLENARAEANLSIVAGRLYTARAREARLLAQRDGLEAIAFPPELLERSDTPELKAILQGQRASFAQRRDTLETRRGILDEQVNQLDDQIDGLRAQIRSFEEQRSLIAEEIEDISFLLEKGLVERPRLRALQRTEASLAGDIEANRSRIAQAQQRIAEIELQRIELENTFREEVLSQLRETQDQVADLTDELAAARDVVDRLVVRAPEAGQIVDLQFHTVGGVVGPGQRIADLVPRADNLVITAKISPLAIDSVTVGLPAEVVLAAFNRNQVPRLEATVTRVSADRLTDEVTGVPYYEASVALNPGQLGRVPDDLTLYPGMPAEVVIVTGERSAWSYFVQPLSSVARKGLVAE